MLPPSFILQPERTFWEKATILHHEANRPDEYRLKEIKEDYKNMTEMFFGEYPSFEELMNSVLELEKEIHKIK